MYIHPVVICCCIVTEVPSTWLRNDSLVRWMSCQNGLSRLRTRMKISSLYRYQRLLRCPSLGVRLQTIGVKNKLSKLHSVTQALRGVRFKVKVTNVMMVQHHRLTRSKFSWTVLAQPLSGRFSSLPSRTGDIISGLCCLRLSRQCVPGPEGTSAWQKSGCSAKTVRGNKISRSMASSRHKVILTTSRDPR